MFIWFGVVMRYFLLGVAMLPAVFASAQSDHRPGHHLLSSHMPPGMIGALQTTVSRNPIRGYLQPVRFEGPRGVQFALPVGGNGFEQPKSDLMAGLFVGSVYRVQMTGLPGAAGAELYPTIEIIDRTYPPPGLETTYPMIVRLDAEDIEAARAGQMVTRVIYLEDPGTAVPLVELESGLPPAEVSAMLDPMHVADALGRPVAILRIGSLAPPRQPAAMNQFFFGYPSWAPVHEVE